MYDLISQIIGHTWVQGDSAQQYIYYTCCAIITLHPGVTNDLRNKIIHRHQLLKNLAKIQGTEIKKNNAKNG